MKIAVITGASSGMGLEFARAIDREEQLDELWLIARREDRLRELAATLKNKCRILTLDLSRSTPARWRRRSPRSPRSAMWPASGASPSLRRRRWT